MNEDDHIDELDDYNSMRAALNSTRVEVARLSEALERLATGNGASRPTSTRQQHVTLKRVFVPDDQLGDPSFELDADDQVLSAEYLGSHASNGGQPGWHLRVLGRTESPSVVPPPA